MLEARNVFESDEEFTRLRGAVMGAIDEFSRSRGGNVTYGEIMFVLEAIIDDLRKRCGDSAEADEPIAIKKMTRVSQVRSILARMLSLLAEKGILSEEEESRLLSGK